jgi:hypothetical protein
MRRIRSETIGLLRAGRADYLAAAYLADFIDQETLAAILSNQRSRNAMDVIHAALAARVVRDNYSVAGVGCLLSACFLPAFCLLSASSLTDAARPCGILCWRAEHFASPYQWRLQASRASCIGNSLDELAKRVRR